MAEKVRALDDTRFVTQAVSGILVGGPELFAELAGRRRAAGRRGRAGINTAITIDWPTSWTARMTSPRSTATTAEAFSHLDVAGYNYMDPRFEIDGELHPNRVIVATETHPRRHRPRAGPGCADNPHVIGDFTWTGWDYLGEVGIGRIDLRRADAMGMTGFLGEYPWRAAWCGDIDITGHRRPQSYYREIVFGLRTEPYLAVRRPEHHGQASCTRAPGRGATSWRAGAGPATRARP